MQLGVDPRTADCAVVRLEFLVQVGERHRHEHVHAAQQTPVSGAVKKT